MPKPDLLARAARHNRQKSARRGVLGYRGLKRCGVVHMKCERTDTHLNAILDRKLEQPR
jgi:hypothetical protein